MALFALPVAAWLARTRDTGVASSAAVRNHEKAGPKAGSPCDARTQNSSPFAAFSSNSAGGSKRSPYCSTRYWARAMKSFRPYWLMNCKAPLLQAAKPIPKIEPMFASAVECNTPPPRNARSR